MAGVKGRSGRRPRSVEQRRLDIIDKAWEITAQKLESDDPDKVLVAKDLVLKDMVNKERLEMKAEVLNKKEEETVNRLFPRTINQ